MIRIDEHRCIGCGLCAGDCLAKAIRVEAGRAEVIKRCFMCGHCVAICPADAVRFEGPDYDQRDVMSVGGGFGIDGETMLHAIKTRRSIRQFKPEPVDRALLEQVLEAGRYSPTASNAENVSYLVFTDETPALARLAIDELRRYRDDPAAFAEVFPPPMTTDRVDFDNGDFFFKGAPAVILTVSPHTVNAAIAAADMELQAVSMGLGTLYVGFFTRLASKNTRIREFLGLGEKEQVVTCTALGWPDVSYQRIPPRKKAKITWR